MNAHFIMPAALVSIGAACWAGSIALYAKANPNWFFVKIYARIRNRGLNKTLAYVLGRFYAVRQFRKRRLVRQSMADVLRMPASICAFSVDNALVALQRDAIFQGLSLAPGVLTALQEALPRARRVTNIEKHPVDDQLLDAAVSRGEPVLTLLYQSEELSQICDRIAQDPALLQVVHRFMRGPYRKISVRVQEHLVTHAAAYYREKKRQTVLFHYDVYGVDFVYAFFYLNACDADSGAHEMIRGSHRRKRLRYLLGVAKQTDEEIYRYYGLGSALIIEGPAGSGFIEDSACFHRLRPPIAGPRIALQIRYSA